MSSRKPYNKLITKNKSKLNTDHLKVKRLHLNTAEESKFFMRKRENENLE